MRVLFVLFPNYYKVLIFKNFLFFFIYLLYYSRKNTFSFYECFYFIRVVPKTPEGGRAFPEQVEERIISALEDRTRDRGKGLG